MSNSGSSEGFQLVVDGGQMDKGFIFLSAAGGPALTGWRLDLLTAPSRRDTTPAVYRVTQLLAQMPTHQSA